MIKFYNRDLIEKSLKALYLWAFTEFLRERKIIKKPSIPLICRNLANPESNRNNWYK